MISWGLFVVGLINAVLGVVVYRRIERGMERGIFLSLLLATAAWAWGITFFLTASSLLRAQLYVNIYYTAALTIAASMLSFALYRNAVRRKLALILPYIPPVLLALFFLIDPNRLVQVVSLTGSLSERVLVWGEAYVVYAVLFLLVIGYAFLLLYTKAGTETGLRRKREYLIVNSLLLTSCLGMVFNLVLPGLGIYDLIAIGPLFSIIFTLAITYSIFRYSLFDLRRSFLISFTYILSLAVIIVAYGLVAYFTNQIVNEDTRDPQTVMVTQVVLVVMASAAFAPIMKMFNTATEKIFFRNEYDSHQVLNNLSKVASHHIALAPLATKSLKILCDSLNTTFAQIVIVDKKGDVRFQKLFGSSWHDTHTATAALASVFAPLDEVTIIDQLDDEVQLPRELKKAGVAAVAELKTFRGVIGYLVIGDKKSGATFSKKDKSLLLIVSGELALAIENSLRYDEIEQFNETLSAKVEEATSELRMSNKRLKAMDQTKDEFISLTSHQLRTPLTTVKGYVSMLLDGDAGELNPQQRRLLEEAFNSSQRMAHLISDFLNISRIQTGKFEIELTETDLSQVLEEEIEQLRQSALSRHITLQYERPQQFPLIQVDESKIRQVMMNFIDNALYYSPPETTVKVLLMSTKNAVEFRVVDHGIGVPASEQHRLFSKFARASNAKKQRPDGTGIGLFMAKKVIVALGGVIIFQSKEGQGSTFGFRLNR